MLGPADAVHERGGPLTAGVLHEQIADPPEQLRWDAAHALNHLGRVGRVVALEDLPHAPGMLEREVKLGGGTRVVSRRVIAGRGRGVELALEVTLPRGGGDERALVLPGLAGHSCRSSGSKPEKIPSAPASENSSPMITGALV